MTAAPLFAGAVHDTDRLAAPWVSVGAAGADGTVAGVADADHVDQSLLPALLTACNDTWYCLPLVRPVIVVVVPAPVNG